MRTLFPHNVPPAAANPGHLMFCSQIHRRQPLQILFGLASLPAMRGLRTLPHLGHRVLPFLYRRLRPNAGLVPAVPALFPPLGFGPGLFPRMPCLLLGQPPAASLGSFTSLFNILTHITPIELPDSSDGPWKKGYNLLPVFMIPLFDTFVNPLFPGKPLISLGFLSFLR